MTDYIATKMNKTADHPVRCTFRTLNALAGRLPWSVPALVARLIPAWVFWASAQTKVDGFAIAGGI